MKSLNKMNRLIKDRILSLCFCFLNPVIIDFQLSELVDFSYFFHFETVIILSRDIIVVISVKIW